MVKHILEHVIVEENLFSKDISARWTTFYSIFGFVVFTYKRDVAKAPNFWKYVPEYDFVSFDEEDLLNRLYDEYVNSLTDTCIGGE